VNAADPEDRLPPSIGGLFGFAFAAYAERVPLYLLLALGAFVAAGIAEYGLPAWVASTPHGQFKIWVLIFVQVFADALVIAAVALGVAARAAGEPAGAGVITGAAVERWLSVIIVTAIAQWYTFQTVFFSGFVQPPEPRALVFVTAPLTWMLWGTLGLIGPIVALTRDRLGGLTGFARAFALSLRRENLLRLAVLSLITLVPFILQTLAQSALEQHHVPRSFFWSNMPIDALTVGPLAAIQTVFALDFARRVSAGRNSGRGA
jgi:hypothetical protein